APPPSSAYRGVAGLGQSENPLLCENRPTTEFVQEFLVHSLLTDPELNRRTKVRSDFGPHPAVTPALTRDSVSVALAALLPRLTQPVRSQWCAQHSRLRPSTLAGPYRLRPASP